MVVYDLNSLEELNQVVEATIESKDPLIIDFWSDEGPKCKVILPLFTEISDKAPKNFKYYKIDVKKHLDVAKEFNIELTPTFILFKDGKKLDDSIGASPHVLEHLVRTGDYWALYGKYGIPPY
ncbi:hypothetical protein M378DRAFT_154863 [Amanita muscaria Koide BX008]|uniref:Thioredoxin domain-containing protein n=1 Tax=Amanita muscaria (strain Koide BX008) TaxID=946122 RepID=A0A0C2T5R9_AMAMK|nr:hypothetical protein M378DRAFT_154863 [Amanita muscaria Koide BX008]